MNRYKLDFMFFLIKSIISDWISKFLVNSFGRVCMKHAKGDDVKGIKLKIIIFFIL